MPAHEHLSQLEFEGMPRRMPELPVLPGSNPKHEPQPYADHGAHHGSAWGRETPLNTRNPLFSADAVDLLYETNFIPGGSEADLVTRQEFIPPWKVMSAQPNINPDAVEHQVQHADPLNLRGDIEATPLNVDGDEHYLVMEGNHRVNAAQRRGQLLMPANVERFV